MNSICLTCLILILPPLLTFFLCRLMWSDRTSTRAHTSVMDAYSFIYEKTTSSIARNRRRLILNNRTRSHNRYNKGTVSSSQPTLLIPNQTTMSSSRSFLEETTASIERKRRSPILNNWKNSRNHCNKGIVLNSQHKLLIPYQIVVSSSDMPLSEHFTNLPNTPPSQRHQLENLTHKKILHRPPQMNLLRCFNETFELQNSMNDEAQSSTAININNKTPNMNNGSYSYDEA